MLLLMKFSFPLVLIGFTLSLEHENLHLLLPKPQKITYSDGGALLIDRLLICCANSSRLREGSNRWLEKTNIEGFVESNENCIEKNSSYDSGDYKRGVMITFVEAHDPLIHNSGYLLKISAAGVHVMAPSEEGLFHGLMTLRQLLSQNSELNDQGR